MKLPFMFTTGEAVLYEVTFPQLGLMDSSQAKAKSGFGKGAASKATQPKQPVDPSSLLGALMQQDESVYRCPPASNKISFEKNIFTDTRGELGDAVASDWQDNIFPMGNSSILKQEQSECPQNNNLLLPEDNVGLFQDNKNSELYNIMKTLGIDFEDIKYFQQDEEFFKNELSDTDDIRDIDITDEILTYVQDSLNKTDLLYPWCQQQQQPMVQNSGCSMQQHLEQQPPVAEQRQLCQKMKHMQVNGMFTNWNSVSSMPLNASQQQSHPCVFSGVQELTQEFPYKSEVNTATYACRQEFIPYKHPTNMVSQLSDFAQIDLPVGGFDRSTYSGSSGLEDFLSCLQQVPESQDSGINSQPVIVTPQTCYAGAVSMYQCVSEMQTDCTEQMQYNPVVSGQQTLLSKVWHLNC